MNNSMKGVRMDIVHTVIGCSCGSEFSPDGKRIRNRGNANCYVKHNRKMLFHERHRKLLFLSALGGVYLPSLSRIIPSKIVNTILKVYTVVPIGSLLICALLSARQMIFLSDDILVKIVSANNICDDVMAFGRAWLFNVNRNQAQALYDLWDEYFTGDGNDQTRKKILDDLKRPTRKWLLISTAIIQLTSCFWCAKQYSNEDNQLSVPMGIPVDIQRTEYLCWVTFINLTFAMFGPMVLSVDMLIMEPMVWVTGEFIRLQQSLADILNTVQTTESGEIIRRDVNDVIFDKRQLEPDFVRVDQQIKKWIIEHQKLLIFHEKMLAVNHWPLAIQLACTITAMCFFSFLGVMLFWSPLDTFINLLYYIPNYALFYLLAVYGDQVKQQSVRVFDSAFATNWSIYPTHIQKYLHIIVMRTNRESNIDILKLYLLDSQTFFMIVQAAYSFYSFLHVIAD